MVTKARLRPAAECDLFVLTGERSGDVYGGRMLAGLRQRWPDLVCAAMGGDALRQAGAEIEQDIDGLAVMGFWPVIQRLPFFIALGHRIARRVRRRRPRLVVTIDYPGFNLRLLARLQHLRQCGTRLVHVVAPQVWAWKPRRAKRVAGLVDDLLCFFPFEPPLFQRHGGAATFVGHPLAEIDCDIASVAAIEGQLGMRPADRLLLLAPGSRRREVIDLLPVLCEAVRMAAPRLPVPAGGRLIVAVSKTPEVDHDCYRAVTDLPLVEGAYHALCQRSHFGLITSGTATLEAAILGLPHIIAYRGDAFSAAVARHVILTDHVGLPNIVHGQRICPELLQWELTASRLAARLIGCWQPERHMSMRQQLQQTRGRLGGPGAMDRLVRALDGHLVAGRRPTVTEAENGAEAELSS